MSKQRKPTPWFDGKPVRPGVYQRKHIDNVSAAIDFSHWNGKQWGMGSAESVLAGDSQHKSTPSLFQDGFQWRGLMHWRAQ